MCFREHQTKLVKYKLQLKATQQAVCTELGVINQKSGHTW